MRPRHVPRSRGEPVRAEYLSANGPDQFLRAVTAKAVDQLCEEVPSDFWRENCGQVKTSDERGFAVRYN